VVGAVAAVLAFCGLDFLVLFLLGLCVNARTVVVGLSSKTRKSS